MGAGYPINFEVSESSPIFTHPLYVKYSMLTLGAINAVKAELMQDILGIYPTPDTQELLAYLSSILRLLNLMV